MQNIQLRHIPFLALAVYLSACASSNLHQLEASNPPADNFSSALAAEYQAYAGSQAELGRADSAQYYAGKGLKALHGEAVAPEMAHAPAGSEDKEQLDTARQLLLGLLTPDLERVSPQQTAHAQLLFDCWQDNAGKDDKTGSRQTATLCAEEFAATSAGLQQVADPLHTTQDTEETVHFDRRHAALNDEGAARIQAIAAKARALPASMLYTIELDGHADSYRKPNGDLAQARVDAVRAQLIAGGVLPERILVAAGGEKAVVLSSDKDANEDNMGDVDITLRSKPLEKSPEKAAVQP